MAFACAKSKFPHPWATLRRTLSSRNRPGKLNENRDHSYLSAVSTSADLRSDSANGDLHNDQKKRRFFRNVQPKDRRLPEEEQTKNGLTFDNFVADQIQIARRSILVRFAVRSPEQYDEAYSEIRKQLANFDIDVVPNLRTVHSPDGLKTFFLLETTSSESLERFVRDYARSAAADHRLVPCRSRILHFTAGLSGVPNQMRGDKKVAKYVPGTDQHRLTKALKDCLWIDEQMRVLVDETSLTESGTRLRFFVSSLMEDAFRGVFPLSVCKPFGSTTNGFGDMNSDLDMDFTLEDPSATAVTRSSWLCAFRLKEDDARKHTQNMVQLFGRIIGLCLPYCADVSRIQNARVPIVKFTHEAGGFGCDLTFDNVTGPAFSKILWVYSHFDPRIRPLVFTIRRWASSMGITHDTPGNWFSNFQLLCLIIYFMQSRSAPSSGHQNLPSIRTLRRLASSNDCYSILGDPQRLSNVKNSAAVSERQREERSREQRSDISSKQESLGDLLREFFLFYGHLFAFDRLGISLEKGSTMDKLDSTQAVVIDNPLETEHNIAKNVTSQELQRFRTLARKALKIMESKECMERNSAANPDSWGLLALCDASAYEKLEDSTAAPSQSRVLLVDDVEIDIFEKAAKMDQPSKRVP